VKDATWSHDLSNRDACKHCTLLENNKNGPTRGRSFLFA
jgi:hypothetical protein